MAYNEKGIYPEMIHEKNEKKLFGYLQNKKNLYFCTVFSKRTNKVLTRGVIGNTSGFGPEESRFEPWRVN